MQFCISCFKVPYAYIITNHQKTERKFSFFDDYLRKTNQNINTDCFTINYRYEEYKNIYSVVTALNEQVNSPTGSLISFNQTF
ncbi:hypothetical protein CN581_29740 [Bacillus toyonensis]|nr:hypothetical protein CN581_29740 [Bacillus toyonensis]